MKTSKIKMYCDKSEVEEITCSKEVPVIVKTGKFKIIKNKSIEVGDICRRKRNKRSKKGCPSPLKQGVSLRGFYKKP